MNMFPNRLSVPKLTGLVNLATIGYTPNASTLIAEAFLRFMSVLSVRRLQICVEDASEIPPEALLI